MLNAADVISHSLLSLIKRFLFPHRAQRLPRDPLQPGDGGINFQTLKAFPEPEDVDIGTLLESLFQETDKRTFMFQLDS